MKFTILIIFIAFVFQNEVQAACNVCANGFACFSTTQYFQCDANGALLVGNLYTCAATQICDNTIAGSLCIAPGTAACNAVPIPLPTTTTTTTTTAAPVVTNWNTWCSTRAGGRYQNPNDATLATYINCYLYNGSMNGTVYKCPGATRFEVATLYCR